MSCRLTYIRTTQTQTLANDAAVILIIGVAYDFEGQYITMVNGQPFPSPRRYGSF